MPEDVHTLLLDPTRACSCTLTRVGASTAAGERALGYSHATATRVVRAELEESRGYDVGAGGE